MNPSPRRTLALLRSFALGRRRRGEPESSLLFLIGFSLGGVRLLADGDGLPLVFPTPERAASVAELLDELGVEATIVPAWRSWGALPPDLRFLGSEEDAARVAAAALRDVIDNAPGWVVR